MWPTKEGLSLRLDVVREILGILDTATSAGQQVLMGKVLDLLRREIARDELTADGVPIVSDLDGLSREAKRPLPDADAFARRAGRVLDALSS